MLVSLLALLPLLAVPTLALDANGMRSRSVYQVVTDRFNLPNNSTSQACNVANRAYCGGNWQGIINKLGYIQGMGFDTVWISPVVENIGGTTGEGQAYHGYWTANPNNLNSNFGSASDLQALSKALHARGMYLMVDVVVNHVAATSSSTFSPSSTYGPFSTTASYHPFCWITDYTNQTQVEQCWLGDDQVALPDLNTESTDVINYWNGWVKNLVSNYTVDAIRIDTVKHIRKAFWPDFVNSAGVVNVGEVLDGDPTYVGPYQSNASINPFNYPQYFPLTRAFNSTSATMDELVAMVKSVKSNFTDTSLLGGFLNNHDNPRFESWQSDPLLQLNAHTFPFVTDGVPYVYYGSEDGFNGGADPLNREAMWTSAWNTSTNMYKTFTNLNAARKAAGASSSSFYTTQANASALSPHEILITKPPMLSVLTNRGQGSNSGEYSIPSSTHGYAGGTVLLDVVSCTNVTVASNGTLTMANQSGAPRVMLPYSMKGNTLCASSTGGSSGGKSAGERSWDRVSWGVAGLLSVVVIYLEMI